MHAFFYKQDFYKQHQAEFSKIKQKAKQHLRLKFSFEEKNTEKPKCLYFVNTEIE